MAKSQLGTKRICPETGRKFYDLNKDPIVSPYTSRSYPLSYFEGPAEIEEEEETAELETEVEVPETVSLEEADEEAAGGKEGEDEALPDLGDDDIDLGDEDEDDTFLAPEEEDAEEDVSGILGGGRGEDEEEL